MNDDLIDRLGKAALECRELISDVHTATKDLRRAIKESEVERKALAAAVRGAISEEVCGHVEQAIGEMMDLQKTAIDAADAKIFKRFERLESMLFGDDQDESLETLAQRYALRRVKS